MNSEEPKRHRSTNACSNVPPLENGRNHRIHSGQRMCDAGCMARIVCPLVLAEDRARLEAIVADRNRAQKHVARAQIILHSADRLNVAEVAKRVEVGRPAVALGAAASALAGVDSLLCDATLQARQASAGRCHRASRGGGADLHRAAGRGNPLTAGPWRRWSRSPCARYSGSGPGTICSRTASAPSSPSHPDFAAKLEAIVGLYLGAAGAQLGAVAR